jgi:hypothetical protein
VRRKVRTYWSEKNKRDLDIFKNLLIPLIILTIRMFVVGIYANISAPSAKSVRSVAYLAW